MDALINQASSTFYTVTGFSMGTLLAWVVSQVLLMLGFGLALVVAMLPIILVFSAITALLYVLYRGLKFIHWL